MIRAIAAIDSKRGLATNEGIPWDLPSDRQREREKTKGGALFMGFRTYLEFAQAPVDRHCFVATDTLEPLREGFEPVTDIKTFMKHPPENLWLFGGAGLFSQTIKYADELDLTRVEGDFNCTKFFPEFESAFVLAQQSEPQAENGITFRYETWKRKR